jgi:hypothetical protein
LARGSSGSRRIDRNGELIPTAPYSFAGRNHAAVDMARVQAICAPESKFTRGEKTIVMWYIGNSPPGMDPVAKTGADIARANSLDPDTYGKMIKKLNRMRIVLSVGKLGRTTFYRISPYIAFCGSGLEQREAIKAWNPPEIPGLTDKLSEQRWQEGVA